MKTASSSNDVLCCPGAVLMGSMLPLLLRMVAILGIAVMLAERWPF